MKRLDNRKHKHRLFLSSLFELFPGIFVMYQHAQFSTLQRSIRSCSRGALVSAYTNLGGVVTGASSRKSTYGAVLSGQNIPPKDASHSFSVPAYLKSKYALFFSSVFLFWHCVCMTQHNETIRSSLQVVLTCIAHSSVAVSLLGTNHHFHRYTSLQIFAAQNKLGVEREKCYSEMSVTMSQLRKHFCGEKLLRDTTL